MLLIIREAARRVNWTGQSSYTGNTAKALTLVLAGLVNKGAVEVVNRQPLQLMIVNPAAAAEDYEKAFRYRPVVVESRGWSGESEAGRPALMPSGRAEGVERGASSLPLVMALLN